MLIKMLSPITGGTFSWRGQEFIVPADGIVEVPEAAVEELKSHGFTTELPEPPAVKAAGKKAKVEDGLNNTD